MPNYFDGTFQLRGFDETDASLTSSNPYLEDNQVCIAPDTGQIAIGPGNWNDRKGLYIDFDNGRINIGINSSFKFDLYEPTGGITVRIQAGDSSIVKYRLVNSVQDTELKINGGTGVTQLQDTTAGTVPLSMNPGCIDDLLLLNGVNVEIGGSTILSASARLSLVAGTYNDLDLSGYSVILANTAAGDITINGLDGGLSSETQSVRIVKLITPNNLIFNHNNASGTQKVFTNGGGTVTKATYANNVLTHHNNVWYLDE